jgi:hypothetical protein
LDNKVIILLEEIAFCLSRGILEKEEYLKKLYASSKSSPVQHDAELQTQPETQREVPVRQGGRRIYIPQAKWTSLEKENDQHIKGGEKK